MYNVCWISSYCVQSTIANVCYWYDRQAVCVRWGNSLSDPFQVNNGVRQGGILSHYLFNVYMDDLSQSLNCCKTGCLSGEIMINHLMYADDLVLLSPSATGLRELLRTCEKYSKEHAIIYNSKKSSVLICKNRATICTYLVHLLSMIRSLVR